MLQAFSLSCFTNTSLYSISKPSMSFSLQKDQVKLFVLVYGFMWALTCVMVIACPQALPYTKSP